MTVSSVDDAVAETHQAKGRASGLGDRCSAMVVYVVAAGRRSVDHVPSSTNTARFAGTFQGPFRSPNSLRRFLHSVGGVMLAYRVREAFPDTEIGITEVSPQGLT